MHDIIVGVLGAALGMSIQHVWYIVRMRKATRTLNKATATLKKTITNAGGHT